MLSHILSDPNITAKDIFEYNKLFIIYIIAFYIACPFRVNKYT
jgi:hypothetical protein